MPPWLFLNLEEGLSLGSTGLYSLTPSLIGDGAQVFPPTLALLSWPEECPLRERLPSAHPRLRICPRPRGLKAAGPAWEIDPRIPMLVGLLWSLGGSLRRCLECLKRLLCFFPIDCVFLIDCSPCMVVSSCLMVCAFLIVLSCLMVVFSSLIVVPVWLRSPCMIVVPIVPVVLWWPEEASLTESRVLDEAVLSMSPLKEP